MTENFSGFETVTFSSPQPTPRPMPCTWMLCRHTQLSSHHRRKFLSTDKLITILFLKLMEMWLIGFTCPITVCLQTVLWGYHTRSLPSVPPVTRLSVEGQYSTQVKNSLSSLSYLLISHCVSNSFHLTTDFLQQYSLSPCSVFDQSQPIPHY